MRRAGKTVCSGGGRLVHRMTVTKPATPTDGETKPTWSNVATNVPCHRRWLGGTERETGSRILDKADYLIEWRYRGDILPTYRLTIGTNVHEVYSVGDPTGDRIIEQARCNLLAST
jgi:head-tail adaptor